MADVQPKKQQLVRKKVDPRIRTLIENGVKQRFRSCFVIVGDKGRDQVVNLHYILSKSLVKARPSVLWCYKKDLGFSSHRKKRMRQVKKKQQRGLYDPDKDDPFELFISATNIRYTYYSESHKILGNTFGMCILQDFEAMTPNLLARTIETVEGGGLVVFLLKTMRSLKQLYTMTMDVHARLRTESQNDVVARFNERFLLSLGSCRHCLVLDDELNVLPVSSHSRSIQPIEHLSLGAQETPEDLDLKNLKNSLKDTEFVGPLIATAKTLDQAKVMLSAIEAISEKTLRTTVTITAARGRGKSAALGIAVASAVASGYSNIFVTSPSPENLKTLFEFVLKGFDCLGYQEHLDYELLQSSNPEFNKAVVRINIFRTHRQTIQYIHPQDSSKLGQAELVVIDEAAAIPLPYVQRLLGPYLVFMASTINGYEGTGRSLSLKLIEQLRKQSGASSSSATDGAASTSGGRVLRELTMQVPIRYAKSDPIEKWLNQLLCLDAAIVKKIPSGCPHPSKCNLYRVNRDTLFSYHKASEAFLQRMMALYVSSHYKNSPNDLLLMSDAPAHSLYVLLGPVDETQNTMPEILCVVQMCLEGEIAKESLNLSLARGQQASGDLIPWTISQQFQDRDFGTLSGARVIRIATHPDYQKMGYGKRALEQLAAFFQGDLTNLDETSFPAENVEESLVRERQREAESLNKEDADGDEDDGNGILSEEIKPRRNLPPLLQKLDECRPERLHWLGVSYGVTQHLYNFWSRSGYRPVYLRLTQNDLTGEHSCIMIRSLKLDDTLEIQCDPSWLDSFNQDFKRRFLSLLSYDFRKFPAALALSILDYKANKVLGDTQPASSTTSESAEPADGLPDEASDMNLVIPNATNDPELAMEKLQALKTEMDVTFSGFDIKRLECYANNMIDYHAILDLLPAVARFYFLGKFATVANPSKVAEPMTTPDTTTAIATTNPGIILSYVQAAVLLQMGLQHKTIDDSVAELTLPSNQLLALFSKVIKKAVKYFRIIQEWEIETTLPKPRTEVVDKMQPLEQSLDEELEEKGSDALAELAKKQEQLLQSLGNQFIIKGTDEDWARGLKDIKGKKLTGISISRAAPKEDTMKRKKKASAEGDEGASSSSGFEKGKGGGKGGKGGGGKGGKGGKGGSFKGGKGGKGGGFKGGKGGGGGKRKRTN